MLPRIEPCWPALPGVCALSTTRVGGVSAAPYESLNLGAHVGDTVEAVAENRRRLSQQLPKGTEIQWLNQVHGNSVFHAPSKGAPDADACWTTTPGIALAIMTADCLPVLLSSVDGSVVAAAHAGWRGLAGGVLHNVVSALPCESAEVQVWLGPAIGPQSYEVGSEVQAAFAREIALHSSAGGDQETLFRPSSRGDGHSFANLAAIATVQLRDMGISNIYGGADFDTFSDHRRFFSHRRSGTTGRQVSTILIAPR